MKEEEKIINAFKDKDWAEIKSSDSWVIFKVMSEFVEGFEKLAKIGPCVTIFGSARTQPAHPDYKIAEDIAFQLVKHGYGVITGGGPGIMEAGNKGAHRAGGKSVGLNIFLPHEQKGNPYIDPEKLIMDNGKFCAVNKCCARKEIVLFIFILFLYSLFSFHSVFISIIFIIISF